MAQLWKGRFKKELAKETNDFNASIHFDSRMYKEDITGSMGPRHHAGGMRDY